MTTIPAPVVVFAYNRPLHLQRTLDALAECRLAQRTEVHVFADGPRTPAAVDAVADVKSVLSRESRAGRFAAFYVHASEVNLGLAASVIRGVGHVLKTNGRVIVLEDDLRVSADFLEFMNDCLTFYESDPSIGSVTGMCPIRSIPAGYTDSLFAVGRNSSTGWGTWSRVWDGVDWSAASASELHRDLPKRRAFNREGNDRYDRLRRQLAGQVDSWSIRFGLSLFQRGLLSIYPVVNRVDNIGYDGSGVNCRDGQAMSEGIAEAPYALTRVKPDPTVQAAFRKAYSGRWPGRWVREVLVLFPRLAGWVGR